jgi:DNA repair protein RadB
MKAILSFRITNTKQIISLTVIPSDVREVLDKTPTGCKAIDSLLGGGFSSGSVNLVYGEAETGKTTLMVQCAINCARQGYKSLFVDCDGAFSTRRFSQIASDQAEEIGQRLILMRPNDFNEQALVIDQLDDYVTKDLGLIILDTVTSLYRLKVSESPSKTFELNRELNRQLATLAQTARTRKIAVLVTSQVHSAFGKLLRSIEPVAPRVLTFWAETVIFMKPTEDPQKIKMILESQPGVPERACYLRVGGTGITEYMVS